MIVDEEVYLNHSGVLGMKWGVRRQRRVEALKRGGTRRAEGGKVVSRVRAAGNVGPVDIIKGRGIRGGAARKAVRVQSQLKRHAAGKATTMDLLKRYGSTRPLDLVPVARSRSKIKTTAKRDIVPAVGVVAVGALAVAHILATQRNIRSFR